MQAEQPSIVLAIESCRCRGSTMPVLGGQGLRQFLEPGPQVPQPRGDVHGGEAYHLAAAFQFAHEVDHRPFP